MHTYEYRKQTTGKQIAQSIYQKSSERTIETVCGTLSIDGEGLSLSEWNAERGWAALDGRIDAVTYFDKKQEDSKTHNGLFGKLLK